MTYLNKLLGVGFALIVIGTIVVITGSLGSPNSSTGIVIFIGPVPIVVGSGSNGGLLMLIALVAAVGMILAFYLPLLARRRERRERP